MLQLITEEDFHELPDEPEQKWILLERIARARLYSELSGESVHSEGALKLHYMGVVTELAKTFKVDQIAISGETSTDRSFEKFELAVSRAQSRVWATSVATYPFGRVALSKDAKGTILDLTSRIETQINSLDATDRRRAKLHEKLEDFRREINQPKTRVGSALTSLVQVMAVVAAATTTVAQADDAFVNILRLIGAEQAAEPSSELLLLEQERRLLLEPPSKMIEGPNQKESGD